MKITSIQAFALDVPIFEDERTGMPKSSVDSRQSLPMLFVRIDTDAGISGWGEAFAYSFRDATRLVLEDAVIPRCIGHDCSDIDALLASIERSYRNCKTGLLTFALSAVDIALWDIRAKSEAMPLHAMIGQGGRHSVSAYASLVRYSQPEAVARAVGWTAERGYQSIKLHEKDFAPAAAARAELGGDFSLMVDASSAWDLPDALSIAEQLRALDLDWLEEPTWPPEDYTALEAVGMRNAIRLAAGENVLNMHDFTTLSRVDGIEILQPSVCKIGGISRMQDAISIGALAGRDIVPHAYFLGPGLLASLHLVSLLPGTVPLEHAIFDVVEHPYDGMLRLHDGVFELPEGVGLGIDPDPDFIEKFAIG